MSPSVSVVMAAYNAERHIDAAIRSVLAQSLPDLELIVVDDASTDQTPSILDRFATEDPRVRILRNSHNRGPYASANVGLGSAKAPVIARIDSDDIAEPSRLERQLRFLDAHPDHLIVGSGYRSIDDAGTVRFERRNPMGDTALRFVTRFRMPMVHPSFCFRASYPDGRPVRYSESTPTAQDYGLVAEVLRHGKGAVLPDVLVRYRMHQGNISTTRRDEQNLTALGVATRFLNDECGSDVLAAFLPLLETLYRQREPDGRACQASARAFEDLIAADARGDRRTERWMQRRAAGILAEAFIAGDSTSHRVRGAGGFVLCAPRFIGPLVIRAMEIKELVTPMPGP